MTRLKCPTCDGDGVVVVEIQTAFKSDAECPDTEEVEVDCVACKGAGHVECVECGEYAAAWRDDTDGKRRAYCGKCAVMP